MYRDQKSQFWKASRGRKKRNAKYERNNVLKAVDFDLRVRTGACHRAFKADQSRVNLLSIPSTIAHLMTKEKNLCIYSQIVKIKKTTRE